MFTVKYVFLFLSFFGSSGLLSLDIIPHPVFKINFQNYSLDPGLIDENFSGFNKGFKQIKKSFLKSDKNINKLLVKQYFQASQKLLEEFPPKDYAYVFLGASPTLFAAIFENLKQDQILTIDLPLSFNHDKDTFLTDEGRAFFDLIFSPYLNEQRKIILVDYVVSGQSLLKAKVLLEKYWHEKNNNKTIKTYPLLSNVALFKPEGFERLYVMPNLVSWHIHKEIAKNYRKYPKINYENLKMDNQRPLANKAYSDLVGFFNALKKVKASL